MTHNLSIDDETWEKLEGLRGHYGFRSIAAMVRQMTIDMAKHADILEEQRHE